MQLKSRCVHAVAFFVNVNFLLMLIFLAINSKHPFTFELFNIQTMVKFPKTMHAALAAPTTGKRLSCVAGN